MLCVGNLSFRDQLAEPSYPRQKQQSGTYTFFLPRIRFSL